MTEKRFTIGMFRNYVNDNKTDTCYVLDLPSRAEYLCNLLNQLVDENEQLRVKNEQLKERLKMNCPEFVWRDLE